ncbi:transient receptor potential cation channel subfamily V member 1-like [Salarias fasciatus]|uniref:transient receptor potential cation channel subfamily V member 1-like n=1 Tax=Salarias fasciatus TaxID=181472 RepID=UPI0011769B10|nr:transient receptor potential cation channel subfamily V member 1-like [Salarias fasciatus]
MDTNICLSSRCSGDVRSPVSSPVFSRDQLFRAVSQGDAGQLDGLLDYLQRHGQRLTDPHFTDERNGKTALLKALLNLKHGVNDTVAVLLDVAERTGDLEALINSSYTDPFYKGQTALHVAIERRSLELVRLLVQKGADVQARASGKFFQRDAGRGFYFGELPLSLAACTNQPDVVSFLMENRHRRADAADADSQGNTVLHALVVVADDSEDNTHAVAHVYDQILVLHRRLQGKGGVRLEDIQNQQNLSPLQLAATLGRLGIFKHMLQREFVDEETRPLSRKLTEWVYGPVRSALYDLSSIDTTQAESVLELIVFGSETPNRPQMLQVEPLRSLLEEKWQNFASRLLLVHFLVYMIYLSIFTMVAFYRKEGQPPFPVEDVPLDYLRTLCELLSVLGAVWFLYKSVSHFRRNPPTPAALRTDGFSDLLFFLQASLLLLAAVLYCCGLRDYLGPMVLSLALAWINVLYYSRGSRRLGVYSVMMQRIILGDMLHFLCVHSVLLFGFSAGKTLNLQSRQTQNPEPSRDSLRSEVQSSGTSFMVLDRRPLRLLKLHSRRLSDGSPITLSSYVNICSSRRFSVHLASCLHRCRVYRGDHRLLVAQLKLKLRANQHQTLPRPDSSRLNDPNTATDFSRSTRRTLDALAPDKVTDWATFKETAFSRAVWLLIFLLHHGPSEVPGLRGVPGVSFSSDHLTDLEYADDTILLSTTCTGAGAGARAGAGPGAGGRSSAAEPFQCRKPSFNELRFTSLELFKFTIGMGDLEFTQQVRSTPVFYVLLSSYVLLTYVLLLNMLIALMGDTVQRTSRQSQDIWNLQRAFTILDMERTLPRWLRTLLQSRLSRMMSLTDEDNHCRTFLRVEETDWRQWRSELHVIREEDPEDHMPEDTPAGTTFNLNLLLRRIRSRGGRRRRDAPAAP